MPVKMFRAATNCNADWQRGIRIGSLKDGKVTMFIPPPRDAKFSGRRHGGRHRRRRRRQHLVLTAIHLAARTIAPVRWRIPLGLPSIVARRGDATLRVASLRFHGRGYQGCSADNERGFPEVLPSTFLMIAPSSTNSSRDGALWK